MTLTLDAPPSVEAKWNALTDEERERRARYIIAAIEWPEIADNGFPDIDDALPAIQEGLAELDAGKGIPFEDFMRDARARWGMSPK